MILTLEGIDGGAEALSSQMVLIEIWSYPKNPKEVVIESVIDVFAKINAPGYPNEFIDIKDTFPIVEEDNSIRKIYHYIIYDLCYLRKEVINPATIHLKFTSLKGEIKSEINAKIVEFKTIKIKWVDPDGDWFLPREDHASCQTWDQRVWVFGGRRSIDKEFSPIDDVMYFDSRMNKWTKGKNNNNLKPKARYGHVMFWYFNYLIIFGGITNDFELLGDLWVYDVIKEQWNLILDSKNLPELQVSKITGVIPKERAYSTGIMMHEFNSAFLAGGITTN